MMNYTNKKYTIARPQIQENNGYFMMENETSHSLAKSWPENIFCQFIISMLMHLNMFPISLLYYLSIF